MTPLSLSLITLTRDDPAGLSRTLASAAALRNAGAEHVVVDGSLAPLRSSEAADGGRISVLPRPPQGIADAFNAGIAAATREWVWCLNGDDQVDPRLTPDFLQRLLGNVTADVIVGRTTYEGESEPRPHPPEHLRWPPVRSWIPHPSTLVRRRLFDRFGGFDEAYTIAMDYEWWLRAIPSGEGVELVPAPFAVFARGGVSQRTENRPTLRREQAAAVRQHQGALIASRAVLNARWWKAWLFAQFTRRPSPQRVRS